MTADRFDAGVSFAWDDNVRRRVERRADEIRQRRRTLGTIVCGVVIAAGVGLAAMSVAGPSNERVAATAPDATARLAEQLPAPSSVARVLPALHVKTAAGGRDHGVLTPAQLVGAQAAEAGVVRQWVDDTGSVELRPGQAFPDEVASVTGTVVRFHSPGDAEAWTSQLAARGGTPLAPDAGTPRSDVTMLRRPGELTGEVVYLAVFTDGDTAFSLGMVAGGSGGHDGEFVRLVDDWTGQWARPPTSSTAPR